MIGAHNDEWIELLTFRWKTHGFIIDPCFCTKYIYTFEAGKAQWWQSHYDLGKLKLIFKIVERYFISWKNNKNKI